MNANRAARRVRPAAAWPVVAAVAAFVASRAFLAWGFTPIHPDSQAYFERAANGVDLGLTPYRDFTVEYPPLAYWCIALPRWLAGSHYPRGLLASGRWGNLVPAYARVLRMEMLAFDVAAFALLLAIIRRRRRELLAPAAWAYVLLTTILGNVLLERLDIGMLCLLLLWAWAWLKTDAGARTTDKHLARWPGLWQGLAYLALGLGASYKLIPGVLLPLVVIADVRAMRTLKDELRLAVSLLVFAAAAIGPFAYYYHAVGPKLWSMFQYHRARSIEIESLWSTLALALRPVGLAVRAVHGYGSWNIECRFDREMLALSTACMVLILAIGLMRACWTKRPFDRTDAFRWGMLTLVALFVTAKVLSTQYLLWGLPAAILLGVERLSRRGFYLLCGGLLLTAALSTCVFPYLFFPQLPVFGRIVPIAHPLVPQLDWLPSALLIARNALLVALLAWLATALCRGARPAWD
jgi:hypothetical protein